jgi:hypothetical protein
MMRGRKKIGSMGRPGGDNVGYKESLDNMMASGKDITYQRK